VVEVEVYGGLFEEHLKLFFELNVCKNKTAIFLGIVIPLHSAS
jgi:hypothetical protein